MVLFRPLKYENGATCDLGIKAQTVLLLVVLVALPTQFKDFRDVVFGTYAGWALVILMYLLVYLGLNCFTMTHVIKCRRGFFYHMKNDMEKFFLFRNMKKNFIIEL